MESKLTKIQSTGLINKIRLESPRFTSLEKWYNSKEQSFATIKNNFGDDVFKGTMLIEVNDMVKILKADMDALHVREYIDYLVDNFYYFSLSDLSMVKKRLLSTKTFPKPILQDFIIATNEYDNERTRFVENQRQKENSRFKDENALTHTQVLKTYKSLTEAAKIPKLSQKQKDVVAQEKHQAKLKELELMYPKYKSNEECK